MVCGAVAVVVAALLFIILSLAFSAVTFAAFFFLILVTVVAAGVLLFFFDSAQRFSPTLQAGISALCIAYFLLGMLTAFVFLILQRGPGALVVLELIYLLLLGGAVIVLTIATRSAGASEDLALRRSQQLMVLESRFRNLKLQVAPGSSEDKAIDKILEEVRYFDRNTVSQYDTPIMEKLLDLESLLLTKDEPAQPDAGPPQGLIAGAGPPDPSAPPPPPPVTETPGKILDDILKLAAARHQDSARTKRGGF